MFDVFRFIGIHGKKLITPVKVHGATVTLIGMPDAFTKSSLADLALEQVADPKVSLPRIVIEGPKDNPLLSASTKGQLSPEAGAALILQDEEYGNEAPKETAKQRKTREKAEAQLAEELKARGDAHVGNGQPV